jgi:hypothetical protein
MMGGGGFRVEINEVEVVPGIISNEEMGLIRNIFQSKE